MEPVSTPANHPETPASKRVAANVRAELAARQITAASLAVSLGWSKAATSRRLNGSVSWDVDDVEAVADFLRIDFMRLTAERAA